MTLIPATANDTQHIEQLAQEIWMEYYISFIPENQLQYMLHQFYSHEALVAQMQDGQIFYFIYENEKVVGFMSVSKETEATKINKWYIKNEFRGKGIGRKSFEALKSIYSNESHFYLTVNRKNFKSINFYFSLGFSIERVADFDIGNGFFMEDFVMGTIVHRN